MVHPCSRPCRTIHQGVSSANISEKRRRRKNREAAAANHDRLSSAAAAIGPARHAFVSPVTNAPAVDVDHPKQANPSYDDDDDIILIIVYNSPHLNHVILISVKFAWLSFQCDIYERNKSHLHASQTIIRSAKSHLLQTKHYVRRISHTKENQRHFSSPAIL